MTPSRKQHRCLVGQSESIAKIGNGGIGGGRVTRGVLTAALFFLLVSLYSVSVCDFNWVMPAKVLKVVAGDVLDVEVLDLNNHPHKIRVYLARAQCHVHAGSTQAKKYTENTLTGNTIRLAFLAVDPKAMLVEVFYGTDLKNLSDALILEGLAVKGRTN
jgi:endonuclease YncB( thermonuclease family)